MAEHSKKRAEDFSFWSKTATTLEKYKLLVWILAAAILAAGFDYKTPAQNFREIRTDIAKQTARVDTLFARDTASATTRRLVNDKIDILLRFQCITATPREAKIAGLNCESILGGPK